MLYLYLKFYEEILVKALNSKTLRAFLFMPHPNLGTLDQINQASAGGRSTSNILQMPNRNSRLSPVTMPLQRQGGIDLNVKPQFIQKSSSEHDFSLQEGALPIIPQGFTGFGFHFVRFMPDLTVNGALNTILTLP